MPSDEAMRICGLTANAEGHHGGDPDCVCYDIDELVRKSVDAERRRLIPLVCSRCFRDEERRTYPETGTSYHAFSYDGVTVETANCRASPIYKAIRTDEMEKPDAD